MKQSTSFAQVATNLLNVLQGYTKGIRFVLVLTILLIVGIGQVWGAEYELVSFSDIKTNDVIIIVGTKSSTAYAMKNTGTPPTPIKVTISNSKITSTATDITFTATNNGDNTITFVSTTSGTLYCTDANNGVKIGSQTGNNTKFSFDSSVNRLKNIGQTRWLGIYNTQDWRCYTTASAANISGTTTTFYRKVTAAPSCKVTATSNNNSYGTVSVNGTTITAEPADCYQVVSGTGGYTIISGPATVTHEGNSDTLTVNASTDCSIQVNFEKKPVNTYIDNVQDYEEQELCGNHSAPSLTDKEPKTTGTCEQQHWHFMGWVTEANKENLTDDTNIVKANTSVTANGTTYYAVWAIGKTTGGDTSKQYSFDITPSNFNSTSYAANNNEKTSTAKASDGSTLSVKWTSSQVMLQSSVMQWQSGKGYIYNSTDLGTINSVTVTSTAGTFTKYYGTSQQPSSNTTVGNGYFQIKVGNATGKTSKVTVTFTMQGASTTTYSDYITQCTKETVVSFNLNGGSGTFYDVTLNSNTYAIPETEPTRNGYNFTGWKIQGGDETIYKYGTSNSSISNITESITLVAQWSAIEYTITYNLNGGSGVNDTIYTIESEDITLPTPTHSQGLTFAGWYQYEDFTEDPVTVITKGSTGNKEFWAKWEKATPTFAWSDATCTAALEADNTFPTLNNPNSLSPITYTSSNTSVATIDANGNITLVATGTTTITATGAETATHKSATATYTLNVSAANCKWIETDITDINSGDEVVITMSKGEFTWTISNEKNTSTAPTANNITANIQGKYLTTVSDEYKWVIKKNNANLTFCSYSDNANYLYCTNADNGVRVGTGAAEVFVVDGNYLKNIDTTPPRYVGISFNTTPYSWRCYTVTTGVIKDETLKFYKKVCLDSEHYWVTWDANGGQLSDGSTKKLESYQVGADITKPADPTREGYKFTGWNPNPTTMPDENTTFKAQWAELYTVNFYSNGIEVCSFEEVAGQTVNCTNTPTTCDDEYPHFIGWTDTEIDGVATDKPALVTLPLTVSKSQDYHAVFAKGTLATGGDAETVTFANSGYSNQQTISTVTLTNATITFAKGSNNNNAPKYYTTGAAIRCYGGNTFTVTSNNEITNISLSFATGEDSNEITANVGTYSNGVWTGSAKSITFTIAGSSGHRRIASISVTAGSPENLTAFITSCCTPWTAPTLSATTSITVGGTTTITHSGTTHGAVRYTSSNTKIATVDTNNGKVTGKKPGKTTITASWDGVDGAGNYCPAEATIDITITGTFTITYNANHASATGATTATTIAYPTGQGTVAANGFALAEHQFVKWNTKSDGSGTSYNEGASITLTGDTTLYAIWQRYCTITYIIPTGGGTLATGATTTVISGGSVSIPGIENNSIDPEYSCEELIGWTTEATYENANGQKPNPFYAIGSNLSNIIQNTTLYAVYSRAGEGASGTVELTCTDVSTWKSDVLSGSNNAYGTVTTRTAADGSVWKTNGQIQNAGGIDLKENYYIQIPTLPGPATSITMKVSQGNIGSGEDACTDNVASATSRAFYFRSTDNGSNLFTSETTSSRSRTINITEGNYTSGYIINGEGTSHIHSVTVAYGSPNIISTSLNCSNDIDEFTITYNLNQSSVVSGTQITGVCESGVTYKFSEITEYTICSAPRANGYQLVGWNTQANGKGGLTYTPGQVITSVPLSTLTLYAQWAPVVSLSDVGNISTVNATTVGGSVTLPDGERGCDPYEFIGWTEVYPSWNETAQLPALVANPYTPTVPITLYAVYTQRTTAGAFTANSAGGVYEIWVNNSAKDHMAGQINGSYNLYTTKYWDDNYDEANKAPFTITKIDENTYTIQNTDGHYITKHYYDNKLDVEDEWDNLDRYKWTVSTGTNGSWRFTNKAATTYALIYYNNFFRLYSASSVTNGSTLYYDLELTPVESAVYYSAPSCGDYAIHFYTHGGEFVQGYYAYPTAVKEGLNGTVETKFPSATLNGYTFVGWKENSPQDEITDNSPEGDTSATPYGLKKPGDDLITTTRREYHAVYYYYDELQDVDLSGPITTSIFAENNAGEKRFLSGTPSDNPGTLSSTTACGDVAVVNITPGTGENAGKYKININGYDIEPQSTSSTGLARGTEWWNIEETSAGSGEYKIYVQNGRNIVLNGVSFGNYAYNAQGSYNGDYHYVRFGNCREHHWASDPKRKPSIILSSSGPLTVTSTAGQTIKAANKLYVGAANYETQTKIYLSCNVEGVELIYENGTALSSDANGKYLTTTTDGMLTSTTLILTYTPAATTIEDGIETVTITANDAATLAKASRLAEVRHLPATFAIVAKVGEIWYALPSQGLNSVTPPAAYPIEVDNQDDPTAVTAVPENADWSLRQVYKSSGTLDRYTTNGHNLVFVNNESPEKALNPSSSENYLLTNAQYNNYHNATNPGLYEWTPTTTDLKTYQLTNAHRTDRKISIDALTRFGVYVGEITDMRFLPIQDRYTPLAAQVVEWKENSVVVMYNGDPTQTASVSVNAGEAQTTELSGDGVQKDIAVYELAADGLATNPRQMLKLVIGSEQLLLPIPYIIGSATDDATILGSGSVAAKKEIAKVADLVVLNGGKLTADGAASGPFKFRNVTIYGGGKLVIPSDKGFGVASLTLRAGGITDAGEYDYVYPQFELRGTFTNSAGKFYYDYITDYDHWYHLVLPFAGELGSITYPTEFYGSTVTTSNSGSWIIKRYAGDIRATGNYKAWVDIETDNPKPTATTPGVGYIFWGAPKKVSVNGGASTRQKWGIQRITMPTTADNAIDAENDKEGGKTISNLSSYENVANNSGKDNDQGWNLIGNPYMVDLTNMSTSGLHACKLVPVNDAAGNWTGKWEWNDETNIRYLTIPSEHFDTYTAKTVTQAVPLVAGRAFFIQLEGEANSVTFSAANRASLLAARVAANEPTTDIETGIVLSNETMQDEVNFWIKAGKTNDYEYNADYPKTPNNNQFNIYGVHTNGDLSWVATGPEYAAESMPIGYQVPAAGTYVLSLSEIYNSDGLDALYVTDHALSPEVTVDIMSEPYEFSVNQAETNNERFTVSVRVKAKTENGATGLGNVGADGEQIHKFIYQDKMYILHHGVIYDATGKRVITINK
ncbi:MAG: InlB B-repeat-containing protein [Paludibacteraceae bacterium]|nr:InlB B-repeat-containing protein [Paludibacteraceae bacterium]